MSFLVSSYTPQFKFLQQGSEAAVSTLHWQYCTYLLPPKKKKINKYPMNNGLKETKIFEETKQAGTRVRIRKGKVD